MDRQFCCETMGMPIFLCNKGHSYCNNCKQLKSAMCAMCQTPIGEIRNHALELAIDTGKFQCPNIYNGCDVYLSLPAMIEHKKICIYHLYSCPFQNCDWNDSSTLMKNHAKAMHGLIAKTKITFREKLVRNIGEDFILAHGELFYVRKVNDERKIYWIVKCIGIGEKAKNYYYEIEVSARSIDEEFLERETCSNDALTTEDIIESKKYIEMPLEKFVNYKTSKDEISYKLSICRYPNTSTTE